MDRSPRLASEAFIDVRTIFSEIYGVSVRPSAEVFQEGFFAFDSWVVFQLMQTEISGVRTSTRAEQEAHTEAQRLTTQVEEALAVVRAHSDNQAEDLEAVATRLERASRDLAVALRELARERRQNDRR